MSPSPSTSASDATPGESASPGTVLLSLWAVGTLLSLWLAGDVRDWLADHELAPWTAEAADSLADVAGRTGVADLRAGAEVVRAALYGVGHAPPPPVAPIAMAAAGATGAAGAAAHEVAPRPSRVLLVGTLAAGGIYLDQWDLAATPDGKYRERVDEGGKSRPMRLDDGIHYSEAGGRHVAARLLPRLERHVRLVPRDATLGVVERHTFASTALGRRTSYLAWRPRLRAGERAPLVVLLHGADGGPDDFSEHLHGALATAAQAERVVIVAPDGSAGGWWLDSPVVADSRYASLVADDLLADAAAHLPVSEARGLVGLSMGGHGALTLALTHPGRFRAASSISGVVDLTRAADRPALVRLLGPLAEQRARWEERSALQMVSTHPARAKGLALRLTCGVEDRWLDANRALHAELDRLKIAHDYDELPGGHAWSVWATAVPAHVAWQARQLAGR